MEQNTDTKRFWLEERIITMKIFNTSIFITPVIMLLLTACGATVQHTPTVAENSTQVSSSGIDSTWKTYANEQIGFRIQYPANWQEQDLPDENDGQRHHIALQGPEGGVELIWGTGLGGACPEGYQPMTVANGSWSACHTQKENGTDLWNLASQPLGNTDFAGFVYTNDTTAESRAVVLQVVSTLSFP